jgi:tRNA pseudouridine55 synthase
VKLGIQTTTLDLDPNGKVTETKPFDHVTKDSVEQIIPQFVGKIMQVPPIFSALKKDGKRLHEEARKGKTEEELEIEAREVEIFNLKMLPSDERGEGLPSCFGLEIECGGGTYIRSLVRDMGKRLGTVGTMSSLIRTKQGLFEVDHCLSKEDWTPENIYQAIEQSNKILLSREADTTSIAEES